MFPTFSLKSCDFSDGFETALRALWWGQPTPPYFTVNSRLAIFSPEKLNSSL